MVDELGSLIEHEKPSIVIGHSMGGIVALALAGRFADTIQAAGVIGLPVYAGRREGVAYLGRRGRIIESFVRHDDTAHACCTVAHATRRLWMPWARRRFPTLPVEALLCTFDHDARGHEGGLRNLVFGGRVPGLAGAIQVPVRAMHGTADRAAPLAPLQELARQAGWPLRVVQRANHQVIVEQPAVVATWVRELSEPGQQRRIGPDAVVATT
jgi:pimeloyl-ACP methyl ester carboxylesterase